MTEETNTTKYCPRCHSESLVLDSDSTEALSFYCCSHCRSHFAQGHGESLHDRWLSPISIVLYSQIFELDPQKTGESIARILLETRPDLVSSIISEAERELASPTQKVSEIHAFMYADEATLRAHLRVVAKYLRDRTKA
jgi:hypothetical protein